MGIIRIDAADDDRLSDFRNVPDAELLARLGLFVAEGRLVVARLLTSALGTRSVLVTKPALDSLEEVLTNLSVPVYVVPQTVMNDVAGFNFHRGCLAFGIRPPARSWREIVAASRRQDVTAEANTQHVMAASREQDPAYAPSARIVVLERVSNVDNIGSVFRNAAAFGAHGILLQADCADPLYRKAIRTSMAASLTMPYARAPWPETLRELAADGWATVAMTPAGDAPLLRDVAPMLRDRRVAIVLGHEGEGLSGTAIGACTHAARIAMANGVDSVNVATAAAIALYEICNGVGGHLERTLTD